MTRDDQIARSVIRHTIDLQRFGEGVRGETLKELVRLETILVGMISQRSDNTRFKVLLALAESETNKALSAAEKRALRDNFRLIQLEATVAAGQINAVMGTAIATNTVSAAFSKSVMRRALVMGAPAAEWWGRQRRATYSRFADIVRAGVLTGKDNGTMVREWREASGQLRRHAEAQIRTSVMSVANAARFEMYEAHKDLIKGYRVLATLDLRTSALCRARSGMHWEVDGSPMDGTTDKFPGPPPWHWNCRSMLVPILEIDKTFVGMQSSKDGPVAGDISYDQWFKSLPEAEQIEVLGKRKHAIWKEGKLSMRDMVDQSGRPLTIEELEARV